MLYFKKKKIILKHSNVNNFKYIHLPSNKAYHDPFCKLNSQRPFLMLSLSGAYLTPLQILNLYLIHYKVVNDLNDVKSLVVKQFLPKMRYEELQDEPMIYNFILFDLI